MRAWRLLVMSLGLAALVLACEDDPVDDGMVTIAGKVRNVDTGEFAAGVRVRLYGTQYADEVASGSDGSYELRVPQGSKVLLYTDDFSSSNDTWFPFLNVDIRPVHANEDILDWPIHACPWSIPGVDTVGSVTIWSNYLENCDDTENGDIFEPISPESARGIVSVLFLDCNFNGIDSIGVAIDPLGAPVAIARDAIMRCQTGPPVALECNLFHPDTVTWTDGPCWSWAQSFLDDSFSGTSVTVMLTDLKGNRGVSFPSQFNVPVAPGMISFVPVGVFDNEAVNFPKIAKECSWFN